MSAERKLMGTTDATGGPANYIEDVFSTYLYTGNGASQTINNGIDLSTKGGLVWLKSRSAATAHALYDTVRGATFDLVSNSTAAQTTQATGLTAFGSTGFSIGALAKINTNAATYASWTFREQPKFFDVVTYTGNGIARTIAHNLGSVPGMIIVKRTNTTGDWQVYHRSLANTQYMVLNSTAAVATGATRWNSTTPTASVFSIGTDASVNNFADTYIAYLFAHDAGGFGASGTDNVISCGSYTGNGSASGPTVTLGYEPQYLMIKNASGTGNWQIIDNMRGMPVGSADATLIANASNAESSVEYVSPTATGFRVTSTSTEVNASSNTYIYMAIRRGPMKVPTTGTSVFDPDAYVGNGGQVFVTTGFPVDLNISRTRAINSAQFIDRLRGDSKNYYNTLTSVNINAEVTGSSYGLGLDSNTGYADNLYSVFNNGASLIAWNFCRAPGFFDVVCYNGIFNATSTHNHNLGVAPELMICKARSTTGAWYVYAGDPTKFLVLNTTAAQVTQSDIWNNTAPTSTSFTVGPLTAVQPATGAVAYLFATCPGVSKVGSYTGTGAAQTINCGFTAGARFVLIKRTDSTGGWYTFDTARGMVSGTDPYLLMNSTAAEVNANNVFTSSTGFAIQAAAPADINASGGTFIYLAVA